MLEAVGLPVVPSDAWPEVVPLARWVLERSGGLGCVRELCDAIWRAGWVVPYRSGSDTGDAQN